MKYAKPITLISGLVLALSLPVSSALADSATVSAEKSANVRSGAGMNHPVIAWAMKGDSVEVLGTSGKWTQVQLKTGKTGYIYSSLLSAGAASTPSTPSTSGQATIQAEKSVNVRSGAGMNHPVVAWAMKGDTVTVLETSGKWSKVQLKSGKTGYIYSSYLQTNAATVTTGDVHLRSGAGTKYSVLAILKKGTPVTVLEKSGKWIKVSANGQTGYIHSAYCSK